jgi:hypothetical protein
MAGLPGTRPAGIKAALVDRIRTEHPLDLNRRFDSLVFVAGSGRSGTTWLAQLINAGNEYRVIFEPFNPRLGPLRDLAIPSYIPRQTPAPKLATVFRRVLLGKVGNRWTGLYNLRLVSTRRIIKDIHSNLRLAWLRERFPHFPIVLIVRHPCAAAVSQRRIGMALELPQYLQEPRLIEDHLEPFEAAMRGARSEFEQRIFQWCVETYVPLRQLSGTDDVDIVLYEDLLADPESELGRVLARLGKTLTPALLARVLLPSATTWRTERDSRSSEPWHEALTREEVSRAVEILELFGLDRLYDGSPRPKLSGLELFVPA